MRAGSTISAVAVRGSARVKLGFFLPITAGATTDRYSKSIGQARLMIGNAIRMIARAEVPRGLPLRCGHHLRSSLEDFATTIPGRALDQHTMQGKAMGRGLEHFKEIAKLVPLPTGDDPFEDEAYRLWAIKAAR